MLPELRPVNAPSVHLHLLPLDFNIKYILHPTRSASEILDVLNRLHYALAELYEEHCPSRTKWRIDYVLQGYGTVFLTNGSKMVYGVGAVFFRIRAA